MCRGGNEVPRYLGNKVPDFFTGPIGLLATHIDKVSGFPDRAIMPRSCKERDVFGDERIILNPY